MTISAPNLPLDHPAWRLAHQFYLDALRHQSEKVQTALDHDIGPTFEAFLKALADQLLVISSHFLDDGLNYVVAIRTGEGMAPLAKIHAERLGLNDLDTQMGELLNGA